MKKSELLRNFSEKSERLHTVQQLLKAYTLFEKDVDYVIMDNKIKIVDEQTGRIMEGRRWSDGLHQAVEAKENVKVEAATQTYATITLQNYFRMYHKLAGMTGTAETEAGEFWDIYKLDVVVIPTNKPIARIDAEDLIYKTKREKYNAVIDEIQNMVEHGRPVLVGDEKILEVFGYHEDEMLCYCFYNTKDLSYDNFDFDEMVNVFIEDYIMTYKSEKEITSYTIKYDEYDINFRETFNRIREKY